MIVRSLNNIKETPASHEDSQNPGCYKKVIYGFKDFPSGYKIQMINWARIPENKKFSLHYHQDMFEIFIILKGEAQVKINNEHKKVSAGDSGMVSSKANHSMQNIGRGDVEYLVVGASKGKNGKTVILKNDQK